MAIAVRRQPLCADRMSFSCPSRPLGFGLRIDVQHDPRDFLPIGAFSAGIEQSEVGDYMLLIIAGELGRYRRGIGDVRIGRRLLHGIFSLVPART
jgi:hypothetical protein